LVSLEPVVAESDPRFSRETTDWTLRVRVPEHVRPWMVLKGSVALEGISLTIAEFDGEIVSIAILPLTYWRTNLHTLKAGAPIHVEADVLVKLAASQIAARMEAEAKLKREAELDLTEAWLVAEGF
jgi:riboflavin synthase